MLILTNLITYSTLLLFAAAVALLAVQGQRRQNSISLLSLEVDRLKMSRNTQDKVIDYLRDELTRLEMRPYTTHTQPLDPGWSRTAAPDLVPPNFDLKKQINGLLNVVQRSKVRYIPTTPMPSMSAPPPLAEYSPI